MLKESIGQEFGDSTVGPASLFHDVWGFSWEDSKAGSNSVAWGRGWGGWNHLKTRAEACLVFGWEWLKDPHCTSEHLYVASRASVSSQHGSLRGSERLPAWAFQPAKGQLCCCLIQPLKSRSVTALVKAVTSPLRLKETVTDPAPDRSHEATPPKSQWDGEYYCSHFGKYDLQSFKALESAISEPVLDCNRVHCLDILSLGPNSLEIDGVHAKVQPINYNSNKRAIFWHMQLNTYRVPDKHYLIPSSKQLWEIAYYYPISQIRKLSHRIVW